MATVKEIIEKAMAEATYCDTCEQDFTEDRIKTEPNEHNVWWTGTAEIVCEQCAEEAWERWNDRQNEM